MRSTPYERNNMSSNLKKVLFALIVLATLGFATYFFTQKD